MLEKLSWEEMSGDGKCPEGMSGYRPGMEEEKSGLPTIYMYASFAWWGFASVQNRDKIEALINRMKRRGFHHPEHPLIIIITMTNRKYDNI